MLEQVLKLIIARISQQVQFRYFTIYYFKATKKRSKWKYCLEFRSWRDLAL